MKMNDGMLYGLDLAKEDKIVCLVGASGSCKTTIAKELEELGYNIIHSKDNPTYITKKWTCSQCNKDFRAKRNTKSDNVFCSTGCHKKYRNEAAKSEVKYKGDNTYIMVVDGNEVLVDACDIRYLKTRIWNINKHGYAIGWNEDRTKLEYMHRVIVQPDEDKDIDHINGNKLDNRKSNLRECKDFENIRNSKRYSNNRSGVKGVGYNANAGKWIARIGVNKKSIFLGYFDSIKEAEEVRKKAEVEYHGKFRYKRQG